MTLAKVDFHILPSYLNDWGLDCVLQRSHSSCVDTKRLFSFSLEKVPSRFINHKNTATLRHGKEKYIVLNKNMFVFIKV